MTMKRLLLSAMVLAASQPCSANDLLKGILQQTLNNAVQQAAAKVTSELQGPRPAANTGAVPAAPSAAPATQVLSAANPVTRMTGRADFYGGPFYGEYLADYWSRPDASTRGNTPSTEAPGNVINKLTFFDSNPKQPGVVAVTKKLEAVVARLLAHPALKDIRGSSIRPGGGSAKARDGQNGAPVVASTSLLAYPIHLEDPLTKHYPDGTYHTPGEGPYIEISINNTRQLDERWPVGNFDGLMVVARGGMYMIVIPNTTRPVYFTEGTGQSIRYKLNPELLDPSRPPSDIQFMTVYVGMGSSTQSAIVRGKIQPTEGVGRLFGLMFNVDWQALLKEVNEGS
jgi:hypothetical protein